MPASAHLLRPATPASYEISVIGNLDAAWSDRLGGMRIDCDDRNGMPVSTLSGQLADQSALLGVLNALCSIGMPLLSVRCLQVNEAREGDE